MKIVTRNNFYYLGYSFRKDGKVAYRERYIGKTLPENIEEIKEAFLRKCLQETVIKKLNRIRDEFQKEWKRLPESIKKKEILDLSVKFTYNTNAIEGSTITEDETDDLLKRKISPNKPIEDVKETINHAKIFLRVFNENNELSLGLLLDWHKELFEETKHDIAGNWRDYSVSVGYYRAPDWQDLEQIMKDFMLWYNKNKRVLHPIEFAARAHYKFEKIHPFGDGNGRVGRLIIAHILKKNRFPLLVVKYKKRKAYYHALEKDENYFFNYIIRRYINEFKRYLEK
ncbi:Fic family protein [Candidatus Woesearchaeota archaeon]|nr:Fic family protein [Candidatus Woesearchaeota archaeon]